MCLNTGADVVSSRSVDELVPQARPLNQMVLRALRALLLCQIQLLLRGVHQSQHARSIQIATRKTEVVSKYVRPHTKSMLLHALQNVDLASEARLLCSDESWLHQM